MRSIGDFAPLWENTDPAGPAADGHGGRRGTKRLRRSSLDSLDNDRIGSLSPSTSSQSRTISHPDHSRTEPYFVAGLGPADLPSSAAFPHQAATSDKQKTNVGRDAIGEQLASLNPPLYSHRHLSSIDADSTSLQRQHAAVMTAILHVSLLKGDYLRAGKAFGILLRVGPGVNTLALRSGGNWGIGAEILLQQALEAERRVSRRRRSDDQNISTYDDYSDSYATSAIEISDFQSSITAAKDYYEALILQHPFKKQNPHAVDARTFYPALFGLLIYEATESSRRRSASTSSPESSPAPATIRQAELRSARAIAARMDDVLASPPYNTFAPLLRLRGMVALWIADLITDLATAAAAAAEQRIDDDDEDMYSDDEDRRARDEALRLADVEREKAHVCFERCVQAGGDVPDPLLRLDR
ncbi:hypothetical protein ANO11243_064020 [Dothideomycetidae sp. 11243]|nr:hypothetical protein ANO11243_064020 [fungal sp. No.11243]